MCLLRIGIGCWTVRNCSLSNHIISDNLRVFTYNVRGLGENNKQWEIFYYLQQKGVDIVFMQETHSMLSKEKLWSAEWGNKIWLSHGESNSRGVVVLFRKNLEIIVHNVIKDKNGRFLILYVTLQKQKWLLVNIYAPNDDNPEYFQSLFWKLTVVPLSINLTSGTQIAAALRFNLTFKRCTSHHRHTGKNLGSRSVASHYNTNFNAKRILVLTGDLKKLQNKKDLPFLIFFSSLRHSLHSICQYGDDGHLLHSEYPHFYYFSILFQCTFVGRILHINYLVFLGYKCLNVLPFWLSSNNISCSVHWLSD